jgi:hypothetical protein
MAEDEAWVQTRGMHCQTASGGPDSYPARDWVWRNLRLPSLRKRAASLLSNTAPAARRQVVAVLLAPRLSTRVLLITLLDAGAACATFNCRSLACRCRRCARLSYHLALAASSRLPLPRCRPHPPSPTPNLRSTRAAFHATPFHPTTAPARSPKSLPYVFLPSSVIGCRSSAVGSPSLAPQTRCASNPLPSCQKAPTRHSFGLPVSGEQQDCLHPRAHTPSIPQSLHPHHYGSRLRPMSL